VRAFCCPLKLAVLLPHAHLQENHATVQNALTEATKMPKNEPKAGCAERASPLSTTPPAQKSFRRT
jgi:hypothetical protein